MIRIKVKKMLKKAEPLIGHFCDDLETCEILPKEMREAVILACILYEEQKVRTTLHPHFPESIEHALNVLYEWTGVKTDERRTD